MKTPKLIALSLMIGCCTFTFAQSSATSESKYFNIRKTILLPYLEVVKNSVQFKDEDGNNVINAFEASSISFQVKNTGQGEALGCEAKIIATGTTNGLEFHSQNLKPIPVGETQNIVFPIKATEYTATGSVQFTITIDEPNGFGTEPITLTINTKAFDAPLLKIVDNSLHCNGEKIEIVPKKQHFVVGVLLQNVQSGAASDVTLQMVLPDEVILMDGEDQMKFPAMKGGEQKELFYELAVSNNYSPSTLPIQFIIREKFGKFAENKTITLQVNQSDAKTDISLQPINNDTVKDIIIGSMSDNGANRYRNYAGSSSLAIQSIAIVTPFAGLPLSSVLANYNTDFAAFEMRDRDDSFPYALFRIKLKGNGNAVRIAKQSLRLDLGSFYQTEKTVTRFDNQILFLVPVRVRSIYLTCGDGCEQQLIFSGRLEPNQIYEGVVEVR